MRLWQIPCPDEPGHKRLTPFLAKVAGIAGGYTLSDDATGYWKDPASGKEYFDAIRVLQVACDPLQMACIKDAYREAYPDEKTIMLCNLGEAFIEEL